MANSKQVVDKVAITSYILMAAGLFAVLAKGLLAALFAGLLVYSLIHLIAPKLSQKISGEKSKVVVAALLGVVVITALSLATWAMISFFKSDAGNMHTLLQKLADMIAASRHQFPEWLVDKLPVDADEMSKQIADWVREHAVEAKTIGAEAGRTAAHILLGMIIGAMAALGDARPAHSHKPLAGALIARISHLAQAFRNIVFAQVWISAINTAITAVFILIVMPMVGIKLPLAKTLIALTFFAGLLPVVGNLISNTVFVIVGLSVSLNAAIAVLVFMIVIHKLEYFLNARIIGSHIHAKSWELLVVILVMETCFGMPGVIAGPVFYAYLKKELMQLELI
ncbi:MAG: AI-2E family transporter [Burkholderiales bacterium]|nr:AI-2E family transporter [Burkholderiales bacterium]